MQELIRDKKGKITGVVVKPLPQSLETLPQLVSLNRKAITLLKRALKPGKGDSGVAVRVMGEIRQQLDFQLKFMEKVYDVTQQAEFQKAILHEIGLVAPEERLNIIKRLRLWRQERQLVKPE